jgi:hypothetical protein
VPESGTSSCRHILIASHRSSALVFLTVPDLDIAGVGFADLKRNLRSLSGTMACRRYDGKTEFQKRAIQMNDQTLDQPLENGSITSDFNITPHEYYLSVNVGNTFKMQGIRYKITNKEYEENAENMRRVKLEFMRA